MSEAKGKACFFDRDGCLIEEQNYLSDPDRVFLTQGAAEAVQLMRAHGYQIIVVSNQSGIARGYFTIEQLNRVEARICQLFREAGAAIDKFYYCFHHVKGILPEYAIDCDCRKPKPGMLLKAAAERNLDLSECFMVGDKISDVQAGKLAGCKRSALVRTGHGDEQDTTGLNDFADAPDLLTACRMLLGYTEADEKPTAENACNLCPRKCNAIRPVSGVNAERLPGVCRSPRNPVVARAGLHFWEEPLISGTQGSGTVFFSGCNLYCVFCQNYGISSLHQGKEITVERLREIYRELISQGAHNINLVTPTHFTEAILESLNDPLPVPVVYNTNGYDRVETLRRLEGKIQIYLPDLKYADDALGAKYSGVPDYFERATEAIKEMFRQVGPYRIGEDGIMKSGVVIRHLILPGMVSNTLKVIKWVEENFKPGDVFFSLMRQYLPCGRVSETDFAELNRRVSAKEYLRVRNALYESSIEDGFVQDKSAAEKEFIPAFDGSGV